MKDQAFTLIAAVIYIAILYVLVRPGSDGPQLVDTIFSTFSDLVRGVAGFTYDTSSGKWVAPSNG